MKDHQGTVCPAQAVIANCPVPALVNSLVPPSVIPASFAAQAQQRSPSLSSFVVWLGLNRPHLESRTPVKGLYLASAWSHGGGYTPVMMGGRQTAQQMIKDFKVV